MGVHRTHTFYLNAIEQVEYDFDGAASSTEIAHSTTRFDWKDSDIALFDDIEQKNHPVAFDPGSDPTPGDYDPDIDQQTIILDYDGDNQDDILYFQYKTTIFGTAGDGWHKPGDVYAKFYHANGAESKYEEVATDVLSVFGRLFSMGTQVTAFDYNGDNRDDLLIWCPYDNHTTSYDDRKVWLYRSSESSSATEVIYELVKEYAPEDAEEVFGKFGIDFTSLTLKPPLSPDPRFPPPVHKITPSSSIIPTDFNSDGNTDLLIFHKEKDWKFLDTGDGDGKWYPTYKYQLKALLSTGVLFASDTEPAFEEIEFDAASKGLVPADFVSFSRGEVIAVDVNADGYSDIVTLINRWIKVSLAQVENGQVTFLEATGTDQIIGPEYDYPPVPPAKFIDPAHGGRLHPMDYNGDGHMDLLVGAEWWYRTSVLGDEQRRQYLLFRFDPITKRFTKVGEDLSALTADLVPYFKVTPFNFNDDGKTDLLVDCGIVKISNGDGSFTDVKSDLGWYDLNDNGEMDPDEDTPGIAWRWCNMDGGPWGRGQWENGFNYSSSTLRALDMDGNGVQEIYFEGNKRRYDYNQDSVGQIYQRSMIKGGVLGIPHLVNRVTTTYGCAKDTCDNDRYHHRVELAYETSAGSTENVYMPHVSPVVKGVTESYGTNVDTPSATTTYSYSTATYFPEDRENAGYRLLRTTNPDESYELGFYHTNKNEEYIRGHLEFHMLYSKEPVDGQVQAPDWVKTEYKWKGTPIGIHAEGWFVRLEGNESWAKQVTSLDHPKSSDVHGNGVVVTRDYYGYNHNSGHRNHEQRLLVDGGEAEPVTNVSRFENIAETTGGWIWRKHEAYIIGLQGGETMYGHDHVHRATHWEYEIDTGNLSYEWLMGVEGSPGSHQIQTHWAYDEFGNVAQMTDPNGNLTTYTYEDGLEMFYQSIERPTTINVATGTPTVHLISFKEYNYKHGKPQQHIDENGNQTEYTYDHLGRTVSVIRPHYPTGVEETTRYADGVEDAYPRYSETSTPTEASEDPQEVRTYIDGADRLLQTITRGETIAGTVRYTALDTHYDDMGRKVRDEGPYFCTQKDYRTATTCKSDVWLRRDYDYLNRVTTVETSGENVSTTEHVGLMTKHTDPDGKVKFVYKDHRGNIVEIIKPYVSNMILRQQKTHYGYNAANDLLFIGRADRLNQVGQQNSFVYDLYGRMVQSMDPDMGTWTYDYDNNGNLISQTDAKGVTLEFTYDQLNRKTTETGYVPERGSAAYAPAWGFDYYYEEGDTVSYNDKVYVSAQDHWSNSSNRPPLDSCVWKILAEWTVGEYYCAGKRVGHNGLVYQSVVGHYASEDWEPGVDDTMWQLETVFKARSLMTFTYDEPSIDGLDDLPVLNLKGRPYSAHRQSDADPDKIETKVTFDRYDKSGRLLEMTSYISGAPEDSYSTATLYDWAGKATLVTYQDGYQLEYEYHPGTSLVKSVSDPTDPEQIKLAVLEDYQADGKIGTLTTGWNQSTGEFATQTIYDYEPLTLRLKRIYSKNRANEELQNKEYEYSAAGDVTLIEDFVVGKSYNYEYDDFHRLKAEKHDNTNFAGDDYITLVNTFEKIHPHAVKKTERKMQPGAPTSHYEYDNNGNLIRSYNERVGSGGTIRSDWKRISYNAKNMPELIDNYERGRESTTEFVYDTDYKRVRKTVADISGVSSTIYVSKGYEIKITNIGELNEATDTVKYIFAGNLRVAKVTDSEVFYIHKDHLGSTSVITDSMGDYPDGELEYTEYQPYGLPRPGSELSSKTDYAFTDQEYDRSTGFYNYDARLYNPEIGMFITADSIIPDVYDPLQLNRYMYARNNPIKYFDPDGHEITIATTLIIMGVIALFSAVAGIIQHNNSQDHDYPWPSSSDDDYKSNRYYSRDGTYYTTNPLDVPFEFDRPKHRSAIGVILEALAQEQSNDENAGQESNDENTEQQSSEETAEESGVKLPNDQLKDSPPRRGRAPIGNDDHPVELHHRDQTPEGPIDEMTRTDHRGKGNYKKNHSNTGQEPSKIDRKAWRKEQREYWKTEWDNGRFEEKKE